MKDKKTLEILVRFVVNRENREGLAREYGVENDYVSVVKTRYLKLFQALVGNVMREDEEGKLRFSNNDISFLEPYMKW